MNRALRRSYSGTDGRRVEAGAEDLAFSGARLDAKQGSNAIHLPVSMYPARISICCRHTVEVVRPLSSR